jgi:hypothetical protein
MSSRSGRIRVTGSPVPQTTTLPLRVLSGLRSNARVCWMSCPRESIATPVNPAPAPLAKRAADADTRRAAASATDATGPVAATRVRPAHHAGDFVLQGLA